MKSNEELLKMLFANLAELQSKTANERITNMLKIKLELLYDILGEDVPQEYWEQIEKELE